MKVGPILAKQHCGPEQPQTTHGVGVMYFGPGVSVVFVSDRIDTLRGEHAALRAALHIARDASGDTKAQQLQRLKPFVMNHLVQKDLLYREIAQLCADRGDAGGTQIAKIFEDNMRVLSGAVRSFFEKLDELLPNPTQLETRFRTVADVLTRRLDTEEQAVFPIYERNLPH